MLAREKLIKYIQYFPKTGKILRISGRERGRVIDGRDAHGYLRVFIEGKTYPAHVLAWIIMEGAPPAPGYSIDHKNRIRYDNRWSNLRLATVAQQTANKTPRPNRTGLPGVEDRGNCFRARCTYKGVRIRKCFKTAEEAHKEYIRMRLKTAGREWQPPELFKPVAKYAKKKTA